MIIVFRYQKVGKQECLNISKNVLNYIKKVRIKLLLFFVLQWGGEVQILEKLDVL